MQPNDWISFGQLVISLVGLGFLIAYVIYTKRIAKQAVTQNEASFKPAIVVKAEKSEWANQQFSLKNIGKGPAIDLHWELSRTSYDGKISCLEVGDCETVTNLASLTEASMEMGKNGPTVVPAFLTCTYRSISGQNYKSTSEFHSQDARFSTVFEDMARK